MTDFDERHGQLVRVAFERSYLLQNPYFNQTEALLNRNYHLVTHLIDGRLHSGPDPMGEFNEYLL